MLKLHEWSSAYNELCPGDVFMVEDRDAEYVVINNTYHEGKEVGTYKESDTYIIQTNQGIVIYEVDMKDTYRKFKLIVKGIRKGNKNVYIGKD